MFESWWRHEIIFPSVLTLVYGYDPETKQRSSQWKKPSYPRPKAPGKSVTVRNACWHSWICASRAKLWTSISMQIFCGVYGKMREKWLTEDRCCHHDHAPRSLYCLAKPGATVVSLPPSLLARFGTLQLFFSSRSKKWNSCKLQVPSSKHRTSAYVVSNGRNSAIPVWSRKGQQGAAGEWRYLRRNIQGAPRGYLMVSCYVLTWTRKMIWAGNVARMDEMGIHTEF